MTRVLHRRTVSISVDTLLTESAWFVRIDPASQRQVRASIVERVLGVG